MEMNIVDERELKCVLTEEEVLKYSRELAKKNQDRLQVESDKKAVMADYKDKLETLTTAIGRLSRTVSNGYEHRQVKCTWLYDWKAGKKTLSRQDTGERVDVADIAPHERQQKFGLDEEGPIDPTPVRTKPGKNKSRART